MTKQYRNVLQERNKAAFVEVGNRDGSEILITAKTNRVNKNGVSTDFTAGRISYTIPIVKESCDACVTQEFQGSFNLGFNVPAGDVNTLEAFKDEVIRILDTAKDDLVFGVMPPQDSSFAL